MEKGRRGFLRGFGIGAVGTAAVAAAAVTLPASSSTAFHFQCKCGATTLAQVPKNVGDVVVSQCDECKRYYTLTWKGTHFSLKDGR
jgi:hypothetical protein